MDTAEPPASSDQLRLLLKPSQAAKMLGVCVRTLRTLTARGAIAYLPIGKLVRNRPEDLRRWAERRDKDRETQQVFRAFKAIFGRWAR